MGENPVSEKWGGREEDFVWDEDKGASEGQMKRKDRNSGSTQVSGAE